MGFARMLGFHTFIGFYELKKSSVDSADVLDMADQISGYLGDAFIHRPKCRVQFLFSWSQAQNRRLIFEWGFLFLLLAQSTARKQLLTNWLSKSCQPLNQHARIMKSFW
jgi:hypothetical protein